MNDLNAAGVLTESDHDALGHYLGAVLTAYRNDEIAQKQAVADLAHVIAAIDQRELQEVKSWLTDGNGIQNLRENAQAHKRGLTRVRARA